MLTAKLPGKNTGLSLTENTDDLFIKKTLLYGGLLIRLMKTLHRGIQSAGSRSQPAFVVIFMTFINHFLHETDIT